MNLEELLDFCKENEVAISIRYDQYTECARVRLRTNNNYQCQLLVEKECCERAPDKKDHFKFVLNYLLEEINKYKEKNQKNGE